MSTYLTSYGNGVNGHPGDFPDVEYFRTHFPNLLAALQGDPAEGKTWKVPPATLMLFIEGGRLKFCLSPKHGTRVCFGVVKRPDATVASIEQALADNEFEWKIRH